MTHACMSVDTRKLINYIFNKQDLQMPMSLGHYFLVKALYEADLI